MSQKTVKLTGSVAFQDIGTIGQTVSGLSGNMQSVNQILDVGLRNTGNIKDGFLRVSDITAIGLATLNGNVLTAADLSGVAGSITVDGTTGVTALSFVGATVSVSGGVATVTVTGGGGGSGTVTAVSLASTTLTVSGTVTTSGSLHVDLTSPQVADLALAATSLQPITGLGGSYTNTNLTINSNGQITAASNGSGGGGGSLELTDGTTDLTGVTKITVSGLTVGGTSAAATLTASGGGGSTPIPETLTGLSFWWASDDINLPAGSNISRMRDRTPYAAGMIMTPRNFGSGGKLSSTRLNGLNTMDLVGDFLFPTNAALFLTQGGTAGITYFAVFKLLPAAIGNYCTIFGSPAGSGNAVSFYANDSGNHMTSTNTGAAILATATLVNTNNVWVQGNFTYNAATGAYSFRQSQTNAGSGTAATGIGTGSIGTFGADNGTSPSGGKIVFAEAMVYDRGLTLTEIETIEAYLAAKWFPPAPGYDAAVLADNPVAYYKMNEISGTAATDSSPSALPGGTYTGTGYTLGQTAIAAGLGFSALLGTGTGTNGYIDVPAASPLNVGSGSYTVEFWMNPTNLGSYQEPFTIGGNLRIVFFGGSYQLYVNGSAYGFSGTTTLVNGTAYHFVYVSDATANTSTFYLNGAVDLTFASAGHPSAGGDLFLGNLAAVAVHQYQGYMSNAALYATALSSARVAAHYAAGI